MNWLKVEWTRSQPSEYMKYTASIPQLEIEYDAIGIDPGKNFGIAIVRKTGMVNVIYGRVEATTYAEAGMRAMELVLDLPLVWTPGYVGGVEEAAFSAGAGQAGLAYVRMGFYVGLRRNNLVRDVSMVAINTARKSATGNGRRSMADLLPNMNPNAADALGVALHVAGYRASAE